MPPPIHFEQAVVLEKWYDRDPPPAKPPNGDKTWMLVAVVSSGSGVAFYWQRQIQPK